MTTFDSNKLVQKLYVLIIINYKIMQFFTNKRIAVCQTCILWSFEKVSNTTQQKIIFLF